MTKNALLKRGPKNSGMGRPPPIIRAMPERKRFFFQLTPSLRWKNRRPVNDSKSGVKTDEPNSSRTTTSTATTGLAHFATFTIL